MKKHTRPLPSPGDRAGPRTVSIGDLMTTSVKTIRQHETIDSVRQLMLEHGFNSLPVVNEENEARGIITSSDLLNGHAPETKAAKVMTRKVYTVPQYSGVHVAARIMRNHRIHHVIVTHEKKVVGLLSTFDLLQLVEDKRFTLKNAPTSSKRRSSGKRKRNES